MICVKGVDQMVNEVRGPARRRVHQRGKLPPRQSHGRASCACDCENRVAKITRAQQQRGPSAERSCWRRSRRSEAEEPLLEAAAAAHHRHQGRQRS